MAKLTLHNVYGRFRADMFLSSLIESSTLTQPGEMTSLTALYSYCNAYGSIWRQAEPFVTFNTRYPRHFGQC